MEIVGYTTYTAAAGESFDSIAFKFYSNEFMANKLMKNNPRYVDMLVFEGGEILSIPIYDDVESKETLAPWRR